jgi:hypothetical protein
MNLVYYFLFLRKVKFVRVTSITRWNFDISEIIALEDFYVKGVKRLSILLGIRFKGK